ncbi:MAG TPA: CAP domain-containing protein [Gammaproteobacteria bacterium]|nr:CAP domain-containing protein [Gammaproteobacteria bacterium]
MRGRVRGNRLAVGGLALLLSACGPGSEEDAGTDAEAQTGSLAACDQAEDGLAYLNCLRQRTGLTGLEAAPALTRAAQNHADYLVTNGITGHEEDPELRLFTGEWPLDRARETGYDAYWDVAEVIAYRPEPQTALDGLLSAIYHRLGLLRLDAGEVGMATATTNSGTGPEAAFVALTANPAMGENCEPVAADPVKLDCSPDYQTTRTEPMTVQPQWVAWPPPEGAGIPPAFFEETPDPLPDYSVSGYPVSLQFNPTKVGEVTVNELRLRRDGEPVAFITAMDKGNDPNQVLSGHQYAWFPRKRLAWGADYEVTAEVVMDGELKTLEWSFATRELPGPVHTVDSDTATVSVASGKRVNLYLPPASRHQDGLEWSLNHPGDTSLDSHAVDINTLAVTFTARAGQEATVTADLLSGGSRDARRTITLVAE